MRSICRSWLLEAGLVLGVAALLAAPVAASSMGSGKSSTTAKISKSESWAEKQEAKRASRYEQRQQKEAKHAGKEGRKAEKRASKKSKRARRLLESAALSYDPPVRGSLPAPPTSVSIESLPVPQADQSHAGHGTLELSQPPRIDRDESRDDYPHIELDSRPDSNDLHLDRGSYSGDDAQFPDAISVTAEFGAFSGLEINGDVIDAVGLLIGIENTSYGDGMASAFERHPDDHFTDRDGRLSDAARRAIAGGPPYGIYELEIELPFEVLSLLSAPDGLELEFEREDGGTEIEFEIDLDYGASGLLFDGRAPEIPGAFEDPRTGILYFFLATEDDVLDDLYEAFIEVEGELAFEENGDVVERFESGAFRHRELEVETKTNIAVIPEPATGLLIALGLGILARRRRRAL